MKILSVHNHYQQPGGEDVTAEQESQLLRAAGHEVIAYRRSNSEISAMATWQKAAVPVRSTWASDAYHELRQLLDRERPDLAHFHNTHFMISPAGYYACHDLGVPVVQTIQNYRLFCPAAQFLRAGRVCEDCLGKAVPWPGVLHACYRGSRAQTAMVAATLVFHRWRRTWLDRVNRYIAPTAFVRQKLIEGGLPAERVVIKPNFVFPDPGYGNAAQGGTEYLLYAGRLAPEKGIETLLVAWRSLTQSGGWLPTLKIAGDGPLAPQVAEAAHRLPGLEWLGQQPKERVLALMKGAVALVFPSVWYEAFPLVLVEAFAVGLPVIASNLGSMAALVEPGRTGLHCRAGDPTDLATKIAWLATHPAERCQMRQWARAEFERQYTAERNYGTLIGIYESVLDRGPGWGSSTARVPNVSVG